MAGFLEKVPEPDRPRTLVHAAEVGFFCLERASLLDGEIDPRRPDTTLGKAIATITGLLDPQREDSVQKVLEKAVQSVAADDGSLVSGLKALLPTLLKPLQDEVNRLALEIRGQSEVAEALADTTAKGEAFEEEVLPTVQCWAKFAGATVEHVGGDRQPGDIVVRVHDQTLPMNPLVIVIEARDESTARGKKPITDDLGKSLAKRGGHFGIYLAKTQAGLGKEIGDWAEGRCNAGPYVACTVNNLITALRLAVLQTRLQALQNARPEADVSAIQNEVDRARTALRRVREHQDQGGRDHAGSR